MDRMLNPALDVADDARPVLRSYQLRLSASVATPSWTTRLSLRSSGSASPRFSFHSRMSAASSGLMMIRASEPPMKWRRSGFMGGAPPISSLRLICTGFPP